MPIFTVGHGTLPQEEFAALVRAAGIDDVVDVRAHPSSRRNPQYGRDVMARWLGDGGLGYEWVPALGGRRAGGRTSRHVALRNDAFRAYADHMETAEFRAGIEHLVRDHPPDTTAIMCSESVWWRCHRRLIADHLVLVRELDVVHLMHDGRRTPHGVTDGARRDGDHVAYDVGATPVLGLTDAPPGARGA
jgi:uncharacterized protein (DUF488 family)